MKTKHFLLGVIPVFLLSTGCKIDNRYNINSWDDISTEMTLFSKGIRLPLGNTSPIRVDSLLALAGEDLQKYLQTDSDNVVGIHYNDRTDLNQALADLNLQKAAQIDGVSMTEDFSYNLSDLSNTFTINGKEFEKKIEINTVKLEDLQPSDIDWTDINATINDLKDYALDEDQLDVQRKLDTVDINEAFVVLDSEDRAELAALGRQMSAAGITEFAIPAEYSTISFDPVITHNDPLEPIVLKNEIKEITDTRFTDNSLLEISIDVENLFLTDGELIPDISLDFSHLFRFTEFPDGIIRLQGSTYAISKANNWSLKNIPVHIAAASPSVVDGNTINLSPNTTINGQLKLNNTKTSVTAITSDTAPLKLRIRAKFRDVRIDYAEVITRRIELAPTADNVHFDTRIELPKEVKNVYSVSFDENQPITIHLQAKDLPTDLNAGAILEVQVPEMFEVAGADSHNKVTYNIDHIGSGDITRTFCLTKAMPNVQSGQMVMDANLNVTVKPYIVEGTKIRSSDLSSHKPSVKVTMEGKPYVKDFDAETNDITEDVSYEEVFEFTVDGLKDGSTKIITPKYPVDFTLDLHLPHVEGVSVKPDAKGFKVILPSMLRFKNIDPSLNYQANDNSITLKGELPEKVVLHLDKVEVKPIRENDIYTVRGIFKTEAAVCIPSCRLDNEKVQELSDNYRVIASIPDIEVGVIEFTEGFAIDIDQQKVEIKIGEGDEFPKEIKHISVIDLDNVFLNMDMNITGLPPLSQGQSYAIDLKAALPSYIHTELSGDSGIIHISGNIDANGHFSVQPIRFTTINDIDLSQGGIKDTIRLDARISVNDTKIDAGKLTGQIKATTQLSVGNKDKEDKIIIRKAVGQVSYSIAEKDTFKLGTLPDILTQESTLLDVANPNFVMDIRTNLGIPVLGDITIIPFSHGVPVEDKVVRVTNVQLPYSTTANDTVTQKIILSERMMEVAGNATCYQANLKSLLERVPDQLLFKIDANTDEQQESVIEPSANYIMNIQYALNVPLELGERFNIETNVPIDLEGVNKYLAAGGIGLEGTMNNPTPLQVLLNMELQDKDSMIIEQQKECKPLMIPGHTESNFNFYLNLKDKTIASHVSKGVLKIKVGAIAGAVKADDMLQIKDLRIVLPEGITITDDMLK